MKRKKKATMSLENSKERLNRARQELSSREMLNGSSIYPKQVRSDDLVIILDINSFSLTEKHNEYEKACSLVEGMDTNGAYFAVIDESDIRSIPKIVSYALCSWCSNMSIIKALKENEVPFSIQEKDPHVLLGEGGNLKDFVKKTSIENISPMSFKNGKDQNFTDLYALEGLIDDLGYCSIKSMNGSYRTCKIDRFFHTIINSSADDCKVDVHRFIKRFQGSRAATEFKSQNWRRVDEDYMKSHTIEFKTLEDTKDHSYLFFKNCILKISKDKTEKIPLYDLNDDEFVRVECRNDLLDLPDDMENGEFLRFFKNICDHDERREKALRTAIGYLLHRFHSGNHKAIVLVDESNDENTGGTGKGIIWHAIEQIRGLVSIDCRNECNWSSSFRFSEVKESTSVFVYDEMTTRHWEDIFKTITDGMTVECKYQEKFTIPPERSPKILITSNFAPVGLSSSFLRRRAVYELSNHYSESNTPLEEFGHWFFSSDWSQEEWSKFYWFMAECLKDYLRFGLIEISTESLERKKMENIPEKYRCFLEDFVPEIEEGACVSIQSKKLKEAYLRFCGVEQNEGRQLPGTALDKELASSLRMLCKIKGINIESSRTSKMINGEKLFFRGFILSR